MHLLGRFTSSACLRLLQFCHLIKAMGWCDCFTYDILYQMCRAVNFSFFYSADNVHYFSSQILNCHNFNAFLLLSFIWNFYNFYHLVRTPALVLNLIWTFQLKLPLLIWHNFNSLLLLRFIWIFFNFSCRPSSRLRVCSRHPSLSGWLVLACKITKQFLSRSLNLLHREILISRHFLLFSCFQ